MSHNIIIHEVEQGSQEWLNLRIGMVTASKAPSFTKNGKNGNPSECKLTYINDLTTEILINQKIDTPTSYAMQQGIESEPLARIEYQQITGAKVQQVGLIQIDGFYIGCSPDGLIGDDGGLEIKCPQAKKHFEYLKLETAPAEYTAQIQMCLWVTNRKWWDFVSYNKSFPKKLQTKIIRCYRDDDLIQKISTNAYEVEKAVQEQARKYLIG